MERPERLRRPPIGSVKDITEPPGSTPIESEVDLPESPPEAANLGSAPMAVISSELSVDEVVAHYTQERPDLRVGDNGKGGKSLMIRVKEGWLTVIVLSYQGRTMVIRRLLSTDQSAAP